MKNKIKQYLIGNLRNLEYIGDLHEEDGFYYFNVQVNQDVKANFENRIYEVVSIDYYGIGCHVKLKVEANYLEFAVK